LAGPALAASDYSFQGLGDLPGGGFDSRAFGISDDGSTVVGESEVGQRTEAFRWTRNGGMQGLGQYPGGDSYSTGWDVSADGSVVVGQARVGAPWLPFRWTAETGMIALESLNPSPGAEARAVSADGTVIAGQSFSSLGLEPALWIGDAPPIGLGHAPIGQNNGYANGISADGKAVAGFIQVGTGFQAYRWTAETGHVSLGQLSPNQTWSAAYDISADGRVVVGMSNTANSAIGFRWTAETGMVSLGDPTEIAFAVSGDGAVIAGKRIGGAFIWTAETGALDFRQVLLDAGVTELTDWYLYEVNAISADGRTFTGSGINPQGQREAWIATIPEPSTELLAGFGMLAVLTGSYLRRLRAHGTNASR
jgi:probable HAF family extracellular repeat protein